MLKTKSYSEGNFKTIKDLKEIVIYHEPDEIDLDSIAVCLNVRFLKNHENIDHDLIKLWDKLTVKPVLIVFDLDLTLWPFWIDTHATPPFKKQSHEDEEDKHTILDTENRAMTHYADVPKILNTLRNYCLKNNGYMAIASRTSEYDGAMQLLELFDWKKHFNSFQMYGRNKTRHIQTICDELKIENKKEILFFDDDKRNFDDTMHFGLTGHLLDMKYGLTKDDCMKGLQAHEAKFNK